MKNLTREGETIPLPLKSCQGNEPCGHMCFQSVGVVRSQHYFYVQFCANAGAAAPLLPKGDIIPFAIP